MKRRSTLLLALFIAVITRGPAAFSPEHNAADAGQTVDIVLGEKATLPEQTAGQELARYLGKLYPNTRFKVAEQKTSSGMATRSPSLMPSGP